MPRLRSTDADNELPDWATWRSSEPLTIGIEEEFMLLDPRDWSLAFRSDQVIAGLKPDVRDRVTPETHAAVMEVTTGVHRRVADAIAELGALRRSLARSLAAHGLRAAVAGMHPTAVWPETVPSSAPRYRHIGDAMRVLARREPTLATHVHVGVATPRAAVRLLNRLRAHLPLLLALSANSPFWQGRATGFASTRTTVFDAFPRTGLPRTFRSYDEWIASVDGLVRSGAIEDPSFLWWDARLQPRYGTVEIRIMDAQTTLDDVAGLVALVQSLARMELAHPEDPDEQPPAVELVAESRFLAARDGMKALLIDPESGSRVPAVALLERVLHACRRHAYQLGCERELAGLRARRDAGGAARQLSLGRSGDLDRVTASLARAYFMAFEPARRAA
jgi:glutamate---cysteine ligase / carboxylate-amine ligase